MNGDFLANGTARMRTPQHTRDTQVTAPNRRCAQHERARVDARMQMDATRIELVRMDATRIELVQKDAHGREKH